MPWFVPLIFLFLSLGVLGVIVMRKFSALALLDINHLPEVKENRKKDVYIRNQIEKRIEKKSENRENSDGFSWKKFAHKLREIQLQFRQYVGKVERGVISQRSRLRKNTTPEALANKEQEIKSLLKDAFVSLEQHKLEDAETRYIAAIRLDTHNVEAYKGLTDVYMKKQQWEEAFETAKFILQIDRNDDQVYVKLGEISEELGKVEDAIKFYEQSVLINDHLPQRFMRLSDLLFSVGQYPTALEATLQAVELEPENPKYLDKLVEIAILVNNKNIAEDGYQQLRKVNPDNQKLELLRQQIEGLPPPSPHEPRSSYVRKG